MKSKHVYLLIWVAAVVLLAYGPSGSVARLAIPIVYLALPLVLIALLGTSVYGSVRSGEWRPQTLLTAASVVVISVLIIQHLA